MVALALRLYAWFAIRRMPKCEQCRRFIEDGAALCSDPACQHDADLEYSLGL